MEYQTEPKEQSFNPSDFAELDAIIAEAATPSGSTKDLVAEKIKAFEAKRKAEPTWVTLEYIAVWTRNECVCEEIHPATFVRYMRKMKRLRTKEIHWETAAILPKGAKVTNTLVVRKVMGCSKCKDINPATMPLFHEYTGPEGETSAKTKESDKTS